MWERTDNQEVGLEAAILQRKRNSSLVKRTRAENITGLKLSTEATGFLTEAVGEYSQGDTRRTVTTDNGLEKSLCRHE
jgi:hypothetical protein